MIVKKVLQLCCISNFWGKGFDVHNIDLKLGSDVLNCNINPEYFDIVCAAPPCDQFTKANSHNWEVNPVYFVDVARACFEKCRKTGLFWFLENPPGRIEEFIPELSNFRLSTWQSYTTNKEYVLYGNFLIMQSGVRYGKLKIPNGKDERELWDPDLINDIKRSLGVSLNPYKKIAVRR